MRLLKEIATEEIKDRAEIKERRASRAVLFDKEGLIPILFVAQDNYHKLPGGGIDDNETREEALIREVKEETGSLIEIEREVGKIVEFRSKWNLRQESYCYLGKIISKGEPELTEKEKGQGFRVVWLTLNEAIKRIEKDEPKSYAGLFIQKRDLTFLKKAKEILQDESS